MISIDYTLIIVILNFAVLLVILNRLLYKPINKFLGERKERIGSDLDQAQKAKQEADQLVKSKEEELKISAEEIRNLKKKARLEAQSESDKIVKQAREHERKIIQDTEKQLRHEEEEAIRAVKEELATMVASLSEKFLITKLNEAKDQKLIEKLLHNKEEK